MNLTLFVLVCMFLPIYYVCNNRWQNIILLLISIIIALLFLPNESYILIVFLIVLYAFGYFLIRKPSASFLVGLCFVTAYILIIIREQNLVVRSVISFLFLNSVAFLHLCLKQKELPPVIEGGLYITYFPKMICGPYEKIERFLESLKYRRRFSFLALVKGSIFILLGVLERYALAGNLSCVRKGLISSIYHASLIDLSISGMLFGFELFFIISAFTNWAKGTSIIFGIPISDNFRFPFISNSISDFWRRWHISVHIWLKEFIYQPLRKRYSSLLLCTAVTFIISGIWHRPTLGFLLWGILASLLALAEKKSGITKYQKYLGIPLVFITTSLLWNFFQIDIPNLISKGIQLQSCINGAYPGLLITGIIAFALSVFCDAQTKLIEKKASYFILPLFLIDMGLLLVLWPSKVGVNSIYGF